MPRTSPAPAASFRACSRAASALAAALALAAPVHAADVASGALAGPPRERAAPRAAANEAEATFASGGSLDCARAETFDATALPPDRAPHVVMAQGSLGIVTMEPFGRFLAAMGYPERALVDAHGGTMTTDSDVDGPTLAGALAAMHERDGVRPIVIGHSKGGGAVIQALRALAGANGDDLPLVDPRTLTPLPRTSYVDPATGERVRVVDLKLPLAAAIATGRMPRILRGQFELARVLRDVPDSAEAFVGFFIPFDPIAGTMAGDEDPYRALGRAEVRNVVLPARTSHIGAPRADALAADPAARAWIERYRPGAGDPPAELRDAENLAMAAELWYAIKRAWCGEAQRAARAPRP